MPATLAVTALTASFIITLVIAFIAAGTCAVCSTLAPIPTGAFGNVGFGFINCSQWGTILVAVTVRSTTCAITTTFSIPITFRSGIILLSVIILLIAISAGQIRFCLRHR